MDNTAVNIVGGGEDEMRQKVCDTIAARAKEAAASRGQFTIGFSGGSAAKMVCSGLRSRKDVEWGKWHVFTCDERHVQLSDPDSNIAYVQRELLDHVGVPSSNVYPIDPSVDVSAAAEDYVAKLRKVFPDKSQVPKFDFLILGMGPDGHTCSLFPGHPGLEEMKRLVIPITDSPKPPPNRITLTYPVLNNARSVCLLVLQRVVILLHSFTRTPKACSLLEVLVCWTECV